MDIDDASKDTNAQRKLVEDAKRQMKDDIARESLDDLSRYYLIMANTSMHKDYVYDADMHARFSVTNKTETSFDFTFITIDDVEAGYAIPAETTLHYQYENDKWKLADIQIVYPSEKSLNITFDDIEEYYERFIDDDLTFRPIEEEKINGEHYLTYQIGDQINTRNAKTSDHAYELRR